MGHTGPDGRGKARRAAARRTDALLKRAADAGDRNAAVLLRIRAGDPRTLAAQAEALERYFAGQPAEVLELRRRAAALRNMTA